MGPKNLLKFAPCITLHNTEVYVSKNRPIKSKTAVKALINLLLIFSFVVLIGAILVLGGWAALGILFG